MASVSNTEVGVGGGIGPPDELLLLDRVFMRLASAETDEALTSAVGKYLPSCLLKLSSSQEGVRKKVLELLVHINKRVKGNDNIQLPVDALLVQYQVSFIFLGCCLLYTSPRPRDATLSRMPSSA